MSEYDLYINYLCPYVRRALYARAYKSVDANLIQVDLSDKPKALWEVNPSGTVPCMRVRGQGKSRKIRESLDIVEEFDKVGTGAPLFPRTTSGEIDRSLRSQLLSRCSSLTGFGEDIQMSFYWGSGRSSAVANIRYELTQMNAQLANGGVIANDITQSGELSVCDIAFLPFAEVWFEIEHEFLAPVFDGLDVGNIRKWVQNIRSQPWAQGCCPSGVQLRNAVHSCRTGRYRGYELPLEKYNSPLA